MIDSWELNQLGSTLSCLALRLHIFWKFSFMDNNRDQNTGRVPSTPLNDQQPPSFNELSETSLEARKNVADHLGIPSQENTEEDFSEENMESPNDHERKDGTTS